MGIYGPDRELISPDSLSRKKNQIYKTWMSHYTSIPTLIKIIRSKSIRFNRIDHVNDLQEKEPLIFGRNYRRVFVACFTCARYESIPMWKIYTTRETGVMMKIKFRSKVSADELFVKDALWSDNGKRFPIQYEPQTGWPDAEWRVSYNAYQVEYVKNPNKVSYVDIDGLGYSIPENFGKQKSLAWKYENELRYSAIIKSGHVDNSEPELEDFNCLYAKLNLDAMEKNCYFLQSMGQQR